MPDMNRVFLVGNLTKDPELKRLDGGTAVAELRLATTRKFKRASGDTGEDTVFVSVTVWNRLAETASKYLSKGSPVLVEGRLKYDEWDKDGERRSRISVVADRVQFLGRPKHKDESGEPDRANDRPAPRNESSYPDFPDDDKPIANDGDDDMPF